MLQKDKSVTTSSKSATNSATPVQFVKGVGPRLGGIFASRGIATVKELLTFFPRAYEDRSKLFTISELKEGLQSTVAVEVTGKRVIPIRGAGRRSILEVKCADPTGVLSLKWFHAPRGMDSKFVPGAQIIVTGTPKTYQGRAEIIHPEISFGKSADAGTGESRDFGRIVPIYTEIEGIPSRTFRKVLSEALTNHAGEMTEDLPKDLVEKHGLPPLRKAIQEIHFPSLTGSEPDSIIEKLVAFDTPFHWRLIYEEFFKFEYLVLRHRFRMEKQKAPRLGLEGGKAALQELVNSMPFSLTNGQKTALQEIVTDLGAPNPMNRLVQGDVGSGKTAVALLSAGIAISEGHQVALMAPTEILAEQHYLSAKKLFKDKLPCVLLTGKTTNAERALIHERLAKGEPLVAVGTHALLEDPVIFKDLVLTLVDEQHRFGVEQRRTLRRKGTRPDAEGKPIFPHSLVLTATPIPRTLALTAYGDLSVSSIRELPPGRTPVTTKVIRGERKTVAYEKIRSELKAGHQAYFIFPLVTDSEAEGFTQLKSAVTESERLQKEVFPEFKVGLLHGQMKAEEKAAVMDSFKRNEVQILVSTTVVEVGVDVPNATVIAIEHSERFGLSQLHQLRGRVGRSSLQSHCFLLAGKTLGDISESRLEVLEETQDGFQIAEADLEIRGPGEFLGTRQSGGLPFRLADLVRDRRWLISAREDVEALLKDDPDLLSPNAAPLRTFFEREGKIQSDRLKTS